MLRRVSFYLSVGFGLWAALAGLLRAELAVADIPVTKDYVSRVWEIDDGLPGNRVMGIAQTPDGYLWLATSGGLARFDGARFSPFLEKIGQDDGVTIISALMVGGDGALWLGTERGAVARWSAGQLKTVLAETTPPGGWITTLAEDDEGRVWFGAEGAPRVHRWGGGELMSFSTRDGLAGGGSGALGTTVAVARGGPAWYANTRGCGPFSGERFEAIEPNAGGYIHLAPTGTGGMWAIRDRWLIRYGSEDRRRDLAVDLGALSVHVLFEDSRGTLWMGTNNAGLVRYRDGVFARVPIEGAVLCVFEDDEGDIWAGSLAGGVARLRERRFILRKTEDGLRNDDTYSLAEDTEGRLWLAGRNNMLARTTDETNRSFASVEGWNHEWGVMTLEPASGGGMWLGTLAGLMLLHDGKLVRDEFREPITALLTDRRGTRWLATTGGALFTREAGGGWRRWPPEDGLERVLALAEAGDGAVWAGASDGRLWRRTDGRFQPVILPGVREGDAIRFIKTDGADTVWIGVFRRGLFRWRGGEVTRLPDGVGFPFRDPRSLIFGDGDDAWLGTARGLFQVSRAGLDTMLDGRDGPASARHIGRADGLPAAEFALGFRGPTARTRDGHLWMATARGALDIGPQEPRAKVRPRAVLLDEIWSGETLLQRAGQAVALELPPRPKSLKVSYTSPRPGDAQRLRFRYRLLGAGDDAWVDNGAQRSVTFSHLTAGRYRFEVMAGETEGEWAPGVAAVDIVVRAAWWERMEVRATGALLAMGALAWGVRRIVLVRVRARLRRMAAARELERERSRIARDMHDELGANLTHITMLSRLACMEPPESAGGHLEEIAGVARRTVESLDEIVWAVNPRYDTLGALIEYLGMYAAGFLAAAGIACETEQPERPPGLPLSASVRHHLFLAVKEALNNAAKHSGARCVRLRSEWGEGRLRVTVEDDGRGFDPERVEGAISDGLRNQRERLAELGGTCRIESRPGEGARVVLELPLAAESSGVNLDSR